LTAKNPSRLVPGVSPLPGWACLDSGCRPARAFWPEPPSSFRKSGSRSRSGGLPSRRTRGWIEHGLCQPLRCVSTRNDSESRSAQRARSGHIPVRRLGICGGRLWWVCEQGVRACR